MKINEAIDKLANSQDLTEDQTREVLNIIMQGNATDAQIAGFLLALRTKGETVEEITGSVKALLDNITNRVDIQNTEHLIDIVGTGGDGGRTFNISTCSAIIAAAGGVKVAKHGNRAVSSKSGAADVLEALNIPINLDKDEAKSEIESKGMAFLLAPNYHKAMKYVGGVRKELGVRTLFNLMGPIINPSPLKGELMGVYDSKLCMTCAKVLQNIGLERALVVAGDDGLDEITITTTTTACLADGDKVEMIKIDPRDYGIELCDISEIGGGTPKENAQTIIDILKGKKGHKRDIVLMNAGASLYVAKIADSIKDGIEMARELIDSNKAYEKYLEIKIG